MPAPAPAPRAGAGDVEEATSSAIKMISALSDAAVSGGKLSTELSSRSQEGNAKFQPYSKHEYLCRLASFSTMSWFDKPVTSECLGARATSRVACGSMAAAA